MKLLQNIGKHEKIKERGLNLIKQRKLDDLISIIYREEVKEDKKNAILYICSDVEKKNNKFFHDGLYAPSVNIKYVQIVIYVDGRPYDIAVKPYKYHTDLGYTSKAKFKHVYKHVLAGAIEGALELVSTVENIGEVEVYGFKTKEFKKNLKLLGIDLMDGKQSNSKKRFNEWKNIVEDSAKYRGRNYGFINCSSRTNEEKLHGAYNSTKKVLFRGSVRTKREDINELVNDNEWYDVEDRVLLYDTKYSKLMTQEGYKEKLFEVSSYGKLDFSKGTLKIGPGANTHQELNKLIKDLSLHGSSNGNWRNLFKMRNIFRYLDKKAGIEGDKIITKYIENKKEQFLGRGGEVDILDELNKVKIGEIWSEAMQEDNFLDRKCSRNSGVWTSVKQRIKSEGNGSWRVDIDKRLLDPFERRGLRLPTTERKSNKKESLVEELSKFNYLSAEDMVNVQGVDYQELTEKGKSVAERLYSIHSNVDLSDYSSSDLSVDDSKIIHRIKKLKNKYIPELVKELGNVNELEDISECVEKLEEYVITNKNFIENRKIIEEENKSNAIKQSKKEIMALY